MANAVTLARLPLLAVVIAFLYYPVSKFHTIAAGLLVVLMLMDAVDGIIARWRGASSLLGSVLDIAADRIVELVLWVVFADLDLLPVWLPLIVITRGVFVDAIRAVAPARGLAPFDVQRSRWGTFLIKSPWLRTPFAVAKTTAFVLLALTRAAQVRGRGALGVHRAASISAGIALALCLLRGLPVLWESPFILREHVSLRNE